MRRWWVSGVVLVVGLGIGAAAGRYATSTNLFEQTAELTNADQSGDFEVFYPRPFASPPSLVVIDPLPPETFGRWVFKVTEQRADGFKLHVGYRPSKSPPLSYLAKGLPVK